MITPDTILGLSFAQFFAVIIFIASFIGSMFKIKKYYDKQIAEIDLRIQELRNENKVIVQGIDHRFEKLNDCRKSCQNNIEMKFNHYNAMYETIFSENRKEHKQIMEALQAQTHNLAKQTDVLTTLAAEFKSHILYSHEKK